MKSMFKLGAMLLVTALLPVGAFADEQFDLALPGIDGTDTTAGITDLIPLTNFYYVGTNTLAVIRNVDGTSPLLVQSVDANQHFATATVYVFESTGSGPLQLAQTWTSSNVIAETYIPTSSGNVPTETLGFAFNGLVISSVPEPATVWLMVLGLGGVGFVARRRTASVSMA